MTSRWVQDSLPLSPWLPNDHGLVVRQLSELVLTERNQSAHVFLRGRTCVCNTPVDSSLLPPDVKEERRLRTAYENAEGSEREKFGLFSAGVRESHEKERTRAERTKNWSVIGSVLGALIGVMGSTYINRVRLQVTFPPSEINQDLYFGDVCSSSELFPRSLHPRRLSVSARRQDTTALRSLSRLMRPHLLPP